MPGLFNGGLFGGGGLAQVAQEMGRPESAASDEGNSYRVPMGPDSFDTYGATLVDTDTEVELARWECPSGLQRRWGYGRADVRATLGRLYGVHANSNNETIHGTLVFTWESSTGRETQVIDEHKTEDMNTASRNDRENQIGFPEDSTKKKAEQDEYLVIKFTPSTPASDITNAYAIDAAATEARYPTTEYDVSA